MILKPRLYSMVCIALMGASLACAPETPEGPKPEISDGSDAPDIAGGEGDTVDARADAIAWPAVDEAGPFQVGYRQLETSYTPETFDAPRPLALSLWYPTSAEDGPPAVYGGLITRDDVRLNAPVAGTRLLPVLVFSHGNKGFSQQNWFLMEHLASHGWLVVAPEHEGNTAFDFDADRHALMRLLRPMDISASLDAVLNLPETDDLWGRADAGNVAMAGHSFGGFTTLLIGGATLDPSTYDKACETDASDICAYWTPERRALVVAGFHDPRFKALLPMAPSNKDLFATRATSAITAPTLVFTAALDATSPAADHAEPLWADFKGPQHLRADFPKGGHYTFSNACEIGLGAGDGCGPDFVSPEAALPAIRTLSLAWLRLHIQGDASVTPILTGAEPVSDEVVLSHKAE